MRSIDGASIGISAAENEEYFNVYRMCYPLPLLVSCDTSPMDSQAFRCEGDMTAMRGRAKKRARMHRYLKLAWMFTLPFPQWGVLQVMWWAFCGKSVISRSYAGDKTHICHICVYSWKARHGGLRGGQRVHQGSNC